MPVSKREPKPTRRRKLGRLSSADRYRILVDGMLFQLRQIASLARTPEEQQHARMMVEAIMEGGDNAALAAGFALELMLPLMWRAAGLPLDDVPYTLQAAFELAKRGYQAEADKHKRLAAAESRRKANARRACRIAEREYALAIGQGASDTAAKERAASAANRSTRTVELWIKSNWQP